MENFQEQFDKAIKDYATANQYGVSLIPSHLHNGTDTNNINVFDLIVSPAPKTNGIIGYDTAKGIVLTTATTVNFQTFNSSGTWTMPTGAKWVNLVLISAGGDGGSGSTYNCGGGGGGILFMSFPASILPSTVSVTVGTHGGNSSFGTYAIMGGGKNGGTSYSTAGMGGGNYNLLFSAVSTNAIGNQGANIYNPSSGGNGMCAEFGGASGGAGDPGAYVGGSSLYGGGGGGGSGSNAGLSGGAGGTSGSYSVGGGGIPVSNGAGGAGASGATLGTWCGAGGAGGSGGNRNGGNGGFPGGGGGAASGTGAGGSGANGVVYITTFF